MSMPVNYGSVTKKEALRWGVCFAAVLLLHGGLAAALLTKQDEGDVLDSLNSVEVEFTSEAFEKTEVRNIAPGEEQVHDDVTPPPQEKTEQKSETETPIPPMQQVENPEVALQVEPEKKDEKKEDEKEKSPNATPPLESASTTTAPSAAAVRTASVVSWKRKIARHLQHTQRYPGAARAKGERGVATVAFLVDRAGRIVSSRLTKSSGSSALDHESLDLLQRAQPLPIPPADVPGAQFDFNVPVVFDLK